jgi:hypothetical protein
MSRLFDAKADQQKADAAQKRANEARRRAAEFDQALEEAGIDAKADELGKQLAAAAPAVQAIRYSKFRLPGSKWVIEHAQVGNDYTYQAFPLKPPSTPWPDVISAMIAAMDVIFPRSIQIKYTPPDETYQLKFYTIRVTNVVGLPGWQEACHERALHGLATIDVWQPR